MSWAYLALAIILEVCGTTFMKLSKGLTDIKYAIFMLVLYILSLSMMTLALKKIEIGTAYATWSGMGIVLISVIGFLIFKDAINFQKIIFMSFIIVGVVGLNLTSTIH